MRYTFKSTVAAALVMVAAGAASASTVLEAGNLTATISVGGAEWPFNGGIGTLTFSQTLIDALNTGGVEVQAAGGALSNIVGDPYDYTAVGVSAPVSTLTVGAGGLIEQAQSVGGATQIAGAVKGVSFGGTVSVTNLRIDMVNKHIYADFLGAGKSGSAATAPMVNVNAQNVLAWTFSDITGPMNITGPGTFTTELSGLALTTEGFNNLKAGLGLTSIGLIALQGAATDFGTMSLSLYTGWLNPPPAPFPEPSTYALMGLGLVGLALVRRRPAK